MTGYTAPIIENNATFETFVLTCARAFGACIMQRDQAINVMPNPDQKPSAHYSESVKETEAELAKLLAMTDEEKTAWANDIRNKSYEYQCSYHAKKKANVEAFQSMLSKVEAWTPEEDYAELKRFMCDQINESIKHEFLGDPPILEPLDVASTFDQTVAGLKDSLEYYRAEHAKEIARVEGRNKWVRGLYASLGLEVEVPA
jgi:vacuolar-type H+-ATPase subunit I/STV1